MPAVARDQATVEQAIYTWSSNNRGSGRGLGFGRVSPGLQERVAWMVNDWPEGELGLMLDGMTRSALFSSWRDAVFSGGFGVGDQNVVYRKIADAGRDVHKRDRYLVHLLVGRRDVLDLARVPSDAGWWLDAEQCPLDGLPSLESRSPGDLGHRRFDHDCDEHVLVADVLAELVAARGEPVGWDVEPSEVDALIRAIYIALPTALWPDVQVTSLLTATGIRCELRVAQRAPTMAAAEIEERLHAAGLESCVAHSRIDGRWLRRGSRSWPKWLAALDVATLLAAGDAAPLAPVLDGKPQGPDSGDPLRDVVRSVLGEANWNYTPLSEQGFARVIGASEMARDTFATWVRTAGAGQLRAVLAGLSERRHFAIVKQHLAHVETAALQAAWQGSVAAPIGFALALREDAVALPPGWAVPERKAHAHDKDLQRLAEQLITSATGMDAMVVLFQGGVLEDRPWRNVWLRALLAADFSPDYVFGRLLSESGADEHALWEITVDNVDAFTDWLKMPPVWRTAFQTGLTTKPRLLMRVLFQNPIAR